MEDFDLGGGGGGGGAGVRGRQVVDRVDVDRVRVGGGREDIYPVSHKRAFEIDQPETSGFERLSSARTVETEPRNIQSSARLEFTSSLKPRRLTLGSMTNRPPVFSPSTSSPGGRSNTPIGGNQPSLSDPSPSHAVNNNPLSGSWCKSSQCFVLGIKVGGRWRPPWLFWMEEEGRRIPSVRRRWEVGW